MKPVYFLLFCVVLFSCKESRLRKDGEAKAKEFFNALKTSDEKRMRVLYPGFEFYESYFKSDSATIAASLVNNSIVTVWVHNRYTNGFGKLNEKDIVLYFKEDSAKHLGLFDARGLTEFEEKDEYIFGMHAGCISAAVDTTDQMVIKSLKRTKKVMLEKAIEVYRQLKGEVNVVSWSWESGYAGSASGKGIVRNNSDYVLPELKYKVIYMDYNGTEITSDDGYITYNKFASGESRSFTFYTSYVANATRARIELIFDDDMIYKYLAAKEWKGDECSKYYQENPEL